LLEDYPLIDCEQNVELGCFGGREKVAVFQSRQSGLTCRLAVVAGQMIPQALIQAFVNENAHSGPCEQSLFCFFQCGESQFARDSGKPGEEFFQCFPAFQVVEHRLDWHARAAEYGGSGEDFGVSNNHFFTGEHEFAPFRASANPVYRIRRR